MEKRKLYRVVGILIVVALVIVILPLLTGRNELPFNSTLSVEAPPFPGSASESEASTPPPEHTAPTPVAPRLPEVVKHPTAAEEVKPAPTMISPTVSVSTVSSSAYNDEPTYPVNPASSDQPPIVMPPAADTTMASRSSDSLPQDMPANSGEEEQSIPKKPSVQKIRISTDTQTKKSSIRPGNSVWAIQMGNFHVHTNAIRLANRLRTSGFKAYTRQIVSRTGHISTRVYVGPEVTETSAKKLSARLQDEMHLEGIVVPVEPLAI